MNKNISNFENSFNKAEELRNKGKLIEAIEIFKNILKENSNFQPAINNIANCYFQLNEFDLAEKYYLKCLKLNSKNILTMNNLALLYLKNKKFNKALTVLKVSLERDSQQEHVVEKIAYCLTELNLNKELDMFCKKFMQIYEENNTILSYYRRNLFKIGRYQEGLKAYQKETGVIELDEDKINIS